MTEPLTPERAAELAVLVGQKRATQALRLTLPASVALVLNAIEDTGALTENQFSAACDQVADLVPGLRVTVTNPPGAPGTGTRVRLKSGDRVRLVENVGYLAAGCEGAVATVFANVHGQQISADVLVDGFGQTNLPRHALERLGTVATPQKKD